MAGQQFDPEYEAMTCEVVRQEREADMAEQRLAREIRRVSERLERDTTAQNLSAKHHVARARETIARSRALIDNANIILRSVHSNPAVHPLKTGRPGGTLVTEPLHEEHARLLRQMTALKLEHQRLVHNRTDVLGHEQHREKLAKQLAELREHIRRLRGQKLSGLTSPIA